MVTLTNGFAEEESGMIYELQEDELCRLLDRVLDSYNDFLVRTYVDRKLPADEFSCIDTGNLDLMESLDQL